MLPDKAERRGRFSRPRTVMDAYRPTGARKGETYGTTDPTGPTGDQDGPLTRRFG
jgi:hypothetical protein